MPSIYGPGFVANEIDESYQAPGVGTLGACFIGFTERGPAFQPTLVDSWDDFQKRFGGENVNYYMPYALKGYLKYQNPATIIRVLGTTTYTLTIAGDATPQVFGILYNGANSGNLLGEIYSSGPVTMSAGGTSENFELRLSTTETASGLSLDPDSQNYFANILNTRVSSSYSYYVKGGYCYDYKPTQSLITSESTYITTPGIYDVDGSLTKYSNARTTWLISQPFAGLAYNLFKVHTLSDGDNSNNFVKVSIENIGKSANTESTEYGTFDLVVRIFGDTDESQTVLEAFTQLNLDPNSENYILRQIGDKYTNWNTTNERFDKFGNYPQKSKYIRIEMTSPLSDVPKESLPHGFRAYPVPALVSGSSYYVDALPTRSDSAVGGNVNKYFGIDFTKKIADALKVSMTHSLGSGSNYYATYSINGLTSTSLDTPSYIKWRKFTVPFYKGYDSLDHNKYVNYTSLATAEENAFLVANDIVGNPEEVDVTDIFVPGVSDATVIADLITKIEGRKDVFAVVDLCDSDDTIATIMTNARVHDSSYAATYYPFLKIYDTTNEKEVVVPPSVGVAEVIAFTDSNAEPWYAPAGMRRGVLSRVVGLMKNLYKQDRKDLDSEGVNSIARFPESPNPVIWGQKTLQKKASALQSVNVRRLLIFAKKFLNRLAKNMLFENSNPETWNEFLKQANPWFDDVKNKRGLADFKIIMDSSINTPDIIDRNIMKAAVFLQPRRGGEIILINFSLDKTSAAISFSG